MNEINLTRQEVELLQTILKPIVEDSDNDNFTRKVGINILNKLKNNGQEI